MGGADTQGSWMTQKRRVGSREREMKLRVGTRAIEQKPGKRVGEDCSRLMRRGLPTAACEERERAGERCGMWCEVRPKDESVTSKGPGRRDEHGQELQDSPAHGVPHSPCR